MKKTIFIALTLAALVVISCKKEKANTTSFGYHYFPMTEGAYVVYDVTDISHDTALIPEHDTSVYQIKEVIGEEFIDGVGDTARKLRRYYRLDDTSSWTIQDVWSVKRSAINGEVVEENKRRIKMAFGISYDKDWDCNALNSDDAQSCYYENIAQPFSVAGMNYDSSVTVEQVDFTSFIEYHRAYTVYAPNIGRVYSVEKFLNIDNYDTLDIDKGTELEYIAREWGLE